MPAIVTRPIAKVVDRVSGVLDTWRNRRPAPQVAMVCCVAGVRLRETFFAEVAPALVAAIISPQQTIGELDEMIAQYQEAGVPLVWLIDPQDRTVTIYRPGEEPTLVNA